MSKYSNYSDDELLNELDVRGLAQVELVFELTARLSRARETIAERERLLDEHECLHCGSGTVLRDL
jgi:hypothetical protein